MKTSSKILLGLFLSILLAITIFAIYVVSSFSKQKTGNEYNIAETVERQLPHFYQIESTDGISIEFTQDSVQKVVIIADSTLLKEVITEVKDGKLILHRSDNENFDQNVIIKINADSINKLELSAGSSFLSKIPVKGYILDISASSGSHVEVNLNFSRLKIDLSSGSSADVSGTVAKMIAETSSGSVFTAPKLMAASASVSASSGANMEVNVADDITVEASSGGSISYIGSPVLKSIDVSSGGNFSKK